jgi:hypothetical protein
MTVVAVRVRVWTVRQPAPRSASGDGVRPARRREDGIAYGIVGVAEFLASGVLGARQAVELVPFASLQGGCALIGEGAQTVAQQIPTKSPK